MKDRDFLCWIHERLRTVHKENEHYDYMHKLRAIIRDTPKDKVSINANACNNLPALLESLKLKEEKEEK